MGFVDSLKMYYTRSDKTMVEVFESKNKKQQQPVTKS